MYSRLFFIYLFILLLSEQLYAQNKKTCTQWFPYVEWQFQNDTWSGNAFDLIAKATFEHQKSGDKMDSYMFYDGGKTWKLRFTGTKVGVWTFSTTSKDSQLNGLQGKVTIKPNPQKEAHGFMHTINGKWGWQGTNRAFVPQLVMLDYILGDGSPIKFYNSPKLIDELIQEFIHGHGFSGFHIPVIGGRWFDLDKSNDRVDSTLIEPDLRTFEALESLIAKTHAAGGMVHFWVWGDDSRSQTCKSLKGGMGGDIDLRLQRYIAARLGPLPGWSMEYGFDLDEWVSINELNQWHDYVHQHMGRFHFLGGRSVGPNHGLDHSNDAKWHAKMDYASYEHHRPTYEVYRASIDAIKGKPVMSEDRFRIRPPKYPKKDYSEALFIKGLYHSTMAGGVGNIWGKHPKLSDNTGIFESKALAKTYATFFFGCNRFLSDMYPVKVGSKLMLISKDSSNKIVYQENTNIVKIDLSNWKHSVKVIAVNTLKKYEEVEFEIVSRKNQVLRLPTTSDWIIAIGDF